MLVMLDVVEGERALFAVFQPLVHRLIAPDARCPYIGRDAVEVLTLLAKPAVALADIDPAALDWGAFVGRGFSRRLQFREVLMEHFRCGRLYDA